MKVDMWKICICLVFCLTIIDLANPSTDRVNIKVLKLRKILEVDTNCKLIVSSGHRTVAHNRAVGGARNSFHIKGEALDLVKGPSCKKTYLELARVAYQYYGGVIIYKDHIHVDVRTKKYRNFK